MLMVANDFRGKGVLGNVTKKAVRSSVSVVVTNEHQQILLVQASSYHKKGKWNFPSGRVEPGETVLEAARREAFEETGYQVKITGLLGIYHYRSPSGNFVVRFGFYGQICSGTKRLDSDEISRVEWMGVPEALELDSQNIWMPSVFEEVLTDFQSGKRYSLDMFR